MNDQIPTAPETDPAPGHLYGTPVYGQPVQPAEGASKVALAWWLVVLAGLGIVGRVLIMAACANRISFADNLLSGGTATVDDANQADHLVMAATVFAVVAFFAFVGVMIAVGRRAKRGDAFYAAVNSNPQVRLAGKIYLIGFGVSFILRGVFKQDSSASAEDQIRTVAHGDWATIAYNAVVIVFLFAILVVTRREIAKARAAGTAA